MNYTTAESSPKLNLAPHTRLKLTLNTGDITLHLEKTDGVEMTYRLNTPGASFNEIVSDYRSYQVVVRGEANYDLELS